VKTLSSDKICERCGKNPALRYVARGAKRERGGGVERRGYPRVKSVKGTVVVDLKGKDEVVQEKFCLTCRRLVFRDMVYNDYLEDAPHRPYLDDRCEDGEPATEEASQWM
jgi:hypothetical protein